MVISLNAPVWYVGDVCPSVRRGMLGGVAIQIQGCTATLVPRMSASHVVHCLPAQSRSKAQCTCTDES